MKLEIYEGGGWLYTGIILWIKIKKNQYHTYNVLLLLPKSLYYF